MQIQAELKHYRDKLKPKVNELIQENDKLTKFLKEKQDQNEAITKAF